MKTRRSVRVMSVAGGVSEHPGLRRYVRELRPVQPQRRSVSQAFATYQVNKDFRYYISGPDLNPNALMGLHRSYRLDPRSLWREVQMTPEKMKEIVEGMNTKVYSQHESQKGFEILDNNGRPIGVWYSIMRARTFVSMKEDGTVRIDTPDLDIYEKKTGSILMDTEK